MIVVDVFGFLFVLINLFTFHDHTISNWLFYFQNRWLHASWHEKCLEHWANRWSFCMHLCVWYWWTCARRHSLSHTHTPWNTFSHFAHHHEFHNCPTIRLRRHGHRIFIHDQDHKSPFFWTRFLVWVVRVEQIYWLVELFLNWIRFSFSFRANNILSQQTNHEQ